MTEHLSLCTRMCGGRAPCSQRHFKGLCVRMPVVWSATLNKCVKILIEASL